MVNLQTEYTKYLIGSPWKVSCVKLWKALSLDNKQINRYLEEERTPYELFQEIEFHINPVWWQFCIDDSTLLKEFSRESKADLVYRHWSWRYKKVVMGINLITLFYVDVTWKSFPINWRAYDPNDWKSKNDYFLEMMVESISWWLKPSMVSWDSWYASGANLRFITKQWMWFCFSLKGNRSVRRENELKYQYVSTLTPSKDWEVVHLKDVWVVKVFEHESFYHAYRPPLQKKETAWITAKKLTRNDFEPVHRNHRRIEEYHRVLQQVCNIENHIFRKKNCVISHIFFAIRSFCVLEINVMLWNLKNRYEYSANALADYTRDFMSNM